MKKYILVIYSFFASSFLYSQDNSKYFHAPFPVYSSDGQVTIAGDIEAFVYTNYYAKNVQAEKYTDPHTKPEYLVYELFLQMKKKNVDAVGKLYDASFDKTKFNGDNMAEKIRDYNDIKFASKFRSGEFIIVRYDFISGTKKLPFFAAIKNRNGKYFLTMQINVSDPFNVIGSLSPNNLFDKKTQLVNTKTMTAFYFVNKDDKVLFTNQVPDQSYSALYLAFDFSNRMGNSQEAEFLKNLQKTAQTDSALLKTFIAPDQQSLLSSEYYSRYFYSEIKKIFGNYSTILPLATVKINDGKILYFKFGSTGESHLHVASIIMKKSGDKYYLGLRSTDDDINNILWNIYIREAIYDYFNQKS